MKTFIRKKMGHTEDARWPFIYLQFQFHYMHVYEYIVLVNYPSNNTAGKDSKCRDLCILFCALRGLWSFYLLLIDWHMYVILNRVTIETPNILALE